MKYNFDWAAVTGGAPYVTLSSLGIAFNSVSISKLGNPEKVIVGFDADNCVIGVKPFNGEENIKPYEFASRAKGGWIRIGCKDFIKYLQSKSGIDFSTSKRIVAEYDGHEQILIVPIMKAEDSGSDIEEDE